MEKIKKLYQKLSQNGKDELVREALEDLIKTPNDLDRQINVLGAAHRQNWLPNRKRAFWETFPVTSQEWAKQCVTRVIGHEDTDALYALLSANPLRILQEVQQHSPDLVRVWDVNGASYCGLGLAARVGNGFNHYFYVGWESDGEVTIRLEYVQSIQSSVGQEVDHLDTDGVLCQPRTGYWAELPYGFGTSAGQHSFGLDVLYQHHYGYTEGIRRQLGYEGRTGAV